MPVNATKQERYLMEAYSQTLYWIHRPMRPYNCMRRSVPPIREVVLKLGRDITPRAMAKSITICCVPVLQTAFVSM